MKTKEYEVRFSLDRDYIQLKWTMPPGVPDPSTYRYREMDLEVKHSVVSRDTVLVMLRDMEMPRHISNAVLTRVTRNAA